MVFKKLPLLNCWKDDSWPGFFNSTGNSYWSSLIHLIKIINVLTIWRNFFLQRIKTSPELIRSWRAHDSSIVSLEFVEHEDGNYIVSASTDQTARLWSTEGHYVGTFGQVSICKGIAKVHCLKNNLAKFTVNTNKQLIQIHNKH